MRLITLATIAVLALGCASSSSEDTSTGESNLDTTVTPTYRLVSFSSATSTLRASDGEVTYTLRWVDGAQKVAGPATNAYPTDPCRGLGTAWNGLVSQSAASNTAYRSLLGQLSAQRCNAQMTFTGDGIITALRPVP